MADHLTSKRLEHIGEYYFSKKLREIDELNKAGNNVLNLGIGSPDLAPPNSVTEALKQGLSDPNFHRYQSYKGIPELRNAFSKWYQQFYGVSLDPESELLPLIGSKEGIMHICMAFLNSGDEVLIPNPGYPTYSSAVKLAGGTPMPYSLREDNNYAPDFEELEQLELSKVKMMWVNYPHMPTGTPADPALFSKLIAFCRAHDIILINDNPYSFTLTEEPTSILKEWKDEWVLELNSLSKSHNMAGWRIGVVAGHQALIQKVLTFKSNMDSGMFKPVMVAAIEALNQPAEWYQSLNKAYGERKEIAKQILTKLDCNYRNDQVGMFVWSRIPSGEPDGESFADKLLDQYRLFLPPGMIFGSEGDQFVRISLCSNTALLNEAIDRIK